MITLFKLLSALPLWLLHGAGVVLGWLAFLGSGIYRRRFLANARQAGIGCSQWVAAVGESGKLVAELPRLWMGRPVPVTWTGQEFVEAALALGNGVIFLTPHLGCFEVAAQAYAKQFGQGAQPVTVLFRPPRQAWLRDLVSGARTRPGLKAAPTTLAGVKQMIKALKHGESLALLPDQVPPLGMGVWAPFFGQDAYTMTLSARLATQTGATVLLAWGQRLSWGRGYRINVMPLEDTLSDDATLAATAINCAMEALIRRCPQQYLWGYARYKKPRKDKR
ncbi:lysophospholipid acyltransferase family protein [Rhodoferax sp. PAMC 29310]|uniref:lysophospholipid acyltransferase family protein n=1 Tax=Rhodoferax sp. PAMC 29310 TaxID=2822760 RepID=UPI001B321B52|nr:lysophospholipid acyltransferase family protein [Rhodoferax sp. PAMC 29310]